LQINTADRCGQLYELFKKNFAAQNQLPKESNKMPIIALP